MRRDEQQPIAGVLSLIRELTGPATRADNIADLFVSSFRALDHAIDFDLAAAVMLEQHLDLYVVTREGAASLIGPPLIDSIRRTLRDDDPRLVRGRGRHRESGAQRSAARAAAATAWRTPRTPSSPSTTAAAACCSSIAREPFDEQEQQIVEIFAAQVSLLIGQLSAREQIQGLADTDDLTGIANKRYFRRQLPQEIERARVYSLPLTLLMFDIDDFKAINDSFGHTVGDVVLSELCGAVRETLRPPDLFARFGGDEFAIILPHTDLGGACAVADRILQKRPHADHSRRRRRHRSSCSISLGIADYQRDGQSRRGRHPPRGRTAVRSEAGREEPVHGGKRVVTAR